MPAGSVKGSWCVRSWQKVLAWHAMHVVVLLLLYGCMVGALLQGIASVRITAQVRRNAASSRACQRGHA